MFKTLKIFLIVLSLGAFILPKQMLFAQQTEMCCEQESNKDNCCKTENSQPCHDSNSNKNSEKNNCNSECAKCHTCTLQFVFNYIAPEIYKPSRNHFPFEMRNFGYGISFISSNFQNIWQPPKIA